MTDFICIGVPYWLGEKRDYHGAVEAVKALGLHTAVGAHWIDVEGQLDGDEHPVVAVNRALAQAIASQPDAIPLIFAGDCTACLGAMKGLESHQPRVLWYDAHGDFNTTATTPSGFLGGMPLAALVGRDNDWMLTGLDLAPVPEEAIVITDARDLDPEEGQNLHASLLTHLPDVEQLLAYDWAGAPLYVHFDSDILRLDDMPPVSYPAQGGASLSAVIASLEHSLHQARPVGVLFTLWNHSLPGTDVALRSFAQVARAVIGALR